VFLRGHVLDDRLLYESQREDKRKKNLRAMLSRYISEGIPDIRVEITFDGQSCIVTTDRHGLFEAQMNLEKSTTPGWQKITYQVLDEIVENQEPLEKEGEIFINDGNSQFIIVSDVDDTILISHATETLKKLRLILTKNSKTRLPFTGVASFYEALREGNPPEANNPIFYVSSSEWNLYDFLEDFCDVRNIPKGPFMLQTMKTSLWKLIKSGGGTHNHKREKISHLMQVFEGQKFILIGDSGQKDAHLYKMLAEERPEQVLAIYIRDVGKKKRAKNVNVIANSISGETPMLLVSDSYEAAQHAFETGLITKTKLESVKAEFEEQQTKPSSLVAQVAGTEQNE